MKVNKKKYIPFILLLLTFASCKNFLNGSNLTEKVEKEEARKKSPYITVQILIEDISSYIKCLPAPGIYKKEYKKSDKISLSLSVKDSYFFNGWQCWPEGSVEFGDKYSLVTEAKIRNDLSDDIKEIIIKPELFLYPDIYEIRPIPNSNSLNNKNRDIEITFNQRINPDYFTDEENKFKNISIFSLTNNKELTLYGEQYFFKPEFVFSETKCKMKLKTNLNGFSTLFEKKDDVVKLNVKINLTDLISDELRNSSEYAKHEKINKIQTLSYNYVDSVKTDSVSFIRELRIYNNKEDAQNFLIQGDSYYDENAVAGFLENVYDRETSQYYYGIIDTRDGKVFASSKEKSLEKNVNPNKFVVNNKVWLCTKFKSNELKKIEILEQEINNFQEYYFDTYRYDGLPEYTVYNKPDDVLIYNSQEDSYLFITEYQIKKKNKEVIAIRLILDTYSDNEYYTGSIVLNLKNKLEEKEYVKKEAIQNSFKEKVTLTSVIDTRYSTETINVDLHNYSEACSYGWGYIELADTDTPPSEKDFHCKIDNILYSYDGQEFFAADSFEQKIVSEIKGQNIIYKPSGTATFERDIREDFYYKVLYSTDWKNFESQVIKIEKNTFENMKEGDGDSTLIEDIFVPQDINLSAEPNFSKGTHTLKITYPQDFKENPDYLYKFQIEDKTAGTKTELVETSIEVPSIHNYVVTLNVFDFSGNSKKAGFSKEISTNDDTIGPQWNNYIDIENFDEVPEHYHMYITTFPEEVENPGEYKSGLEKNEDGKRIIYYWFMKDLISNFTPEELALINKYETCYEAGSTKAEILLNIVPEYINEKNIYLYLMAKDKKGNYTIRNIYFSPFEFSLGIYITSPTFTKSEKRNINSSGTLFIENNLDSTQETMFVRMYDTKKQEWKNTGIYGSSFCIRDLENLGNDKTGRVYIPADNDTFIQAYFLSCIYGNENYYPYATEYIYIRDKGYYNPKVIYNNNIDNIRNVIPGNKEIIILSEYPTFTHILFSKTNLNKDTDNLEAIWEHLAKEINPYYSEKSYTYKIEGLPREEGFYKVVVYFSDGNKWVSEVYKNDVTK